MVSTVGNRTYNRFLRFWPPNSFGFRPGGTPRARMDGFPPAILKFENSRDRARAASLTELRGTELPLKMFSAAIKALDSLCRH
jgi:hypothetical protein